MCDDNSKHSVSIYQSSDSSPRRKVHARKGSTQEGILETQDTGDHG